MSKIDKKLKRPFPERLISWRVGSTNKDKSKGLALAYIDARDVMQRLDDVCGMDWQCKYTHAETKTICELSIVSHSGEWITRAGGAGDTHIEAEKGAISDAFKRAAVLFGIGRYLYDLPPSWVPIDQYKSIVKPPLLPEWATPKGFDCGLTPDGYLFNSERKIQLDGIADEVTHTFSDTAESKEKAYDIWMKAVEELKGTEEQNYTWFLLDSKIRSTIKTLNHETQRKAA